MRGPAPGTVARPRGSDAAAAPPSGAAEARAETPSLAVPRWVVVGGVAAALLIVGAFLIAAGTSSGSVAVAGWRAIDQHGPGAAVEWRRRPRPPASGRILVVEIVGAVSRPGVFRLPAGSRIGDLVARRVATDRASTPTGPPAS